MEKVEKEILLGMLRGLKKDNIFYIVSMIVFLVMNIALLTAMIFVHKTNLINVFDILAIIMVLVNVVISTKGMFGGIRDLKYTNQKISELTDEGDNFDGG